MPKGLEIERKYLIRMPDERQLSRMEGCDIWDIVQTYLTDGAPGQTRRVREIRQGEKVTYIYTYKAAVTQMTHVEKERELTAEEYTDMLTGADPELKPIRKRRYRIPYSGHLMEIDIYDFWKDRATLEIELESEDEPAAIPGWIDVIREVTGEAAYKNRLLAQAVPMEDLPAAVPETRSELLEALREVAKGSLSPEDMLKKLKLEPFEDLGFARIDHHRTIRQGAPEVIYGAGKTPEQILAISRAMVQRGNRNILITRMSAEASETVGKELPLFYDSLSRIGIVKREISELRGCVVIACGGTSDLYAAEEAALTCETLGSRVVRLYDVGVSGIHRLLSRMDALTEARCVVAVAGMEGALASVIGGLVDCPVIAVPTSVGYGANFGGLSALLSMLNSCASGVSVVNIDNGFGAGYLANMINMTESIPGKQNELSVGKDKIDS